ncbi:Ser-Thr-rich GPI-anchored membrane family protein [Kitasatospora sp. NPDC058478]|uniref:Ser-Thr-rich GPI-anchored membrane family protein n=1 Tax=unclassified Kitasatospora TaxID=2633591 RepID=UPI00366206BE
MTPGEFGGLLRLGLAALSAVGLTGPSPTNPDRPSVTLPAPDAIVVRGDPCLIVWDGGTGDHRVLKLFTGDETSLFAVQTISDTVDGASGQFVWLVPSDLRPGTYALGLGLAPDAGYSGMFEVVAGGGTVPAPRRGPLVLAG